MCFLNELHRPAANPRPSPVGYSRTGIYSLLGQIHQAALCASYNFKLGENLVGNVFSVRKERAKGKGVALKHIFIATTDEVYKGLSEWERKTKRKKRTIKGKERKRWHSPVSDTSDNDSEEVLKDEVVENPGDSGLHC